MEMLALLLVFPLVWPFIAKAIWKHEITLTELSLNIVIVVAAVSAVWAGGRYAQSADVEILNGQVASKDSRRVSCEHDYQCNPHTVCRGTGKARSCTTEYDTCHEHSWDQSWYLQTTVSELEVPRVDRRGTSEPPRWTAARPGDPVAVAHDHTNYIKGAPDSLFSAVAEQTALSRFAEQLPAYPLSIYDLHYVDRVLSNGVAVPDLAAWNKDVAMRLRTLGPQKQANWVVVVTKSADPTYADALRVKWLGGKKNDIVVVLGAPAYPKLEWVRVLSWTDKELFKVQLRDDLLKVQTVDRETVLGLMERHTKASFERKHMKDFVYLANEIQPPGWLLVLAGSLGVAGSIGLSLFLSRNNSRADSRSPSFRRRAGARRF